jgi:hypothetical protein
MTTDLVAWLREQIAEDRRLAEAANVKQDDPEWWCSPVLADLPGTVTVRSRRDNRPMARVRSVTGDEHGDITDGDSVAAHIARWDPARVLAECDAKDRILEDYRIAAAAVRREAAKNIHEPGLATMYAGRDALLSCVRLLAGSYSDRPGYEEWKP